MKNKKKKNSIKNTIFFLIILVISIYVLFLDSYSFFKKYQKRRTYNKLKAEIVTLKKINNNLKKDNIELKKNPKKWEKAARKLGMQKKGEEIYIFKDDKRKTP